MASYNADVRADGTPVAHEVVLVSLSQMPGVFIEDNATVRSLTESKKYEERKWDNLDPFEYVYDKKDPGYVMIINQVNFLDKETMKIDNKLNREGSEFDVEEIIKCFGRQGYNIGKRNIVHNSTKEKLMAEVKRVCEKELDDTNSLIVFVLSHGQINNTFRVHDDNVDVEELVQPFLNVKSFINKPKTFIFQACKANIDEPGDRNIDKDFKLYVNTALTSEPNVLMYFSTVEGDYSYRNVKTGSWFIQELCRNIYSYGHREEILSILMRCNKCLARNYYYPGGVECNKNEKQTPLFISTLTRNFYVSRNKDRYFYINKMNELRKLRNDSSELINSMATRKTYY